MACFARWYYESFASPSNLKCLAPIDKIGFLFISSVSLGFSSLSFKVCQIRIISETFWATFTRFVLQRKISSVEYFKHL